jgi:hypothetical protein
MAVAMPATAPSSPDDHIAALDEPRRSEIERLDGLIREALPGAERLVQGGMLAYGPYRYRYATGREGEASLVALASRKQYISLYVLCETEGGYLAERYGDRLPKASIGKSCIRFKRTGDLDLEVLRELLEEAGRIGPPSPAP